VIQFVIGKLSRWQRPQWRGHRHKASYVPTDARLLLGWTHVGGVWAGEGTKRGGQR